MVRSKPASSKKPKGGVDFKKIKRKIGRKLPPPQNATNTQIKSKAIVLPEQSIASERVGLAVNKKGLTLRELLHQTSHHNAKIRKAALTGVKDLVLTYPLELKLHKLAIIEKLRERICDNDKMVREILYHILKIVIFPRLKEDITGPIISLMMAYVFNAMTHMAVDVRLMAFKFFELVVSNYPSSFILYAEKVLDNYIDILRNNQIYLQDKSKLKNALGGLVHCLSLVASKKGEDDPLCEPNVVKQRCLQAFESVVPKDHTGTSSIITKLGELIPILVNCFQESTSLIHAMHVIDAQSFDCLLFVVQCINLAVKIVLNAINKPHMSTGLLLSSLSNGPDTIRSTLLVLKKLWEAFPIGQMHHSTAKEDEKYFILDVRITEIFLHLHDWIFDTTFLLEKFLPFVESVLLGELGSNLSSNKVLLQKQLGSIIPFIPGLVSCAITDSKDRLLKAFTVAFEDCRVDSKLYLAYLSAIEEMFVEEMFEEETFLEEVFEEEMFVPTKSQSLLLGYQFAWLQEFPKILLELGDRHSSVSKVVLKLLLQIGRSSPPNTPLRSKYDSLQSPFREFYCNKSLEQTREYGPFLRLPIDCQELAICCLYYFSSLSADVIESLACCCLCNDLDPNLLLRIIEVLHSAYKAGQVQISDQIAFLVTLVAQFQVSPEKFHVDESDGKLSNRGTFKSLTGAVYSCLSQMGDNSLVQKLLWKSIFNRILVKPPLDNMHGLLKMIVTLDTRLMKLSEDAISDLGHWISGYLIDATRYIPENFDMATNLEQMHIFRYYVKPCIFLFYGSEKLLGHVLRFLDSIILVDELSLPSHFGVNSALGPLSRVQKVISILIFMHNDVRLNRSLSSSMVSINHILQNIHNSLASNKFGMTFEERHKIQSMFDQLTASVCKLQSWDASNIEEI